MKRILLALLLVVFLAVPVLADEYPAPKVPEKDIIELTAKFRVQVRIPVEQVWRTCSLCYV